MPKKTYRTHGFTLVEIAAVLIIIGIIITGIVSGQELVRTSRLNSVISDIQNHLIAINKFKDEFNALPGDINRATALWATTDDGNADDQILTHDTEALDAWEHLADSNYIKGSFPGRDEDGSDTDGNNVTVGVDVPASNIKGTGYWLRYETIDDGYAYENANYIKYARPDTASGATGDELGGALTPEDARTIDLKMDDGISGQGDIYAVNSVSAQNSATTDDDCVGDPAPSTGTDNYQLTNDIQSCQIWAIIR